MKKTLHPTLILLTGIGVYCSAHHAFAENQTEVLEFGKVEVISTTPLPGIGTTVVQVPSNVQSMGSKEIANQHTLEVSDYISNNFGGVTITEGQSTPTWQL